jgi:hypothetical protein
MWETLHGRFFAVLLAVEDLESLGETVAIFAGSVTRRRRAMEEFDGGSRRRPSVGRRIH